MLRLPAVLGPFAGAAIVAGILAGCSSTPSSPPSAPTPTGDRIENPRREDPPAVAELPESASRVAASALPALGFDPATCRVVDATRMNWSDSSLGCPAPDARYLQSPRAGWRFRFEGPGGEVITIHTDDPPALWVECRGGTRGKTGEIR